MAHSSQPSYSFHGSNSSHSKDNGSGGRTYHIPNYATSYANEKSNLISVHLEEGKGNSRGVIAIVVIFLLFAAIPLSMIALGAPQSTEGGSTMDSDQGGTASMGNQGGTKGTPQDASQDGGKGGAPLEPAIWPGDLVGKGMPSSTREYASWNLSWDDPVPNNHCLAFGSRQYSARLRNLPYFADWIGACKHTEVTIRGVVYPHPTRCETKWPFGGVIGYWTVENGEEGCLGRWAKIIDKGCLKKGSNIRRFQSRLWDLKVGEDWMVLCSTAPLKIQGKAMKCPTSCEDHGVWGIYGVWEIEDPTC